MASGVAAITREMVCVFEPSLWSDFFIKYEPQPLERSDRWLRIRAEKLKEDTHMLLKTCKDTPGKMALVDALQHLGIDHLFAEQIGATLEDIHQSEFNSSSLHDVALRFRLLREHGIWVPTDVFRNFRGKDGRFKKDITNDPTGLLSLYNAAYLFVHNEPELEEAISFASHHLKSMSDGLGSPLAEQVKRALHIPFPMTFRRLETLHYISEYKQEEGHSSLLLELAKLDFGLLQRDNLMELKDISEWWKGLYGTCGLTYARDRMVEAYFWSYTVFYEQNYARARMMFAKLVVLISLLDDTYDAHATIEECRELNAAIQRWDESAVSLVPEYLKNFYHKLLETFREFKEEVAIIDNHRIDCAKRAFQKQSTYYLQEVEWLHQNHKPCFEDHVNLSSMSSAVPLLCVGMMVGMGDAITDEALEWVVGTPDAVVASAKIGRFMNDIAAYKHGKNKGDIESSVECHMNEHQVTSDDAFATIDSLVEDEWKTINQARFEHRAILSTVKRVVNMAVSMRLYYDDRKDAFTFGTILEDVVNYVFLKPVTI